MFDGQSQNEIDALAKADPEFAQLYQLHKELDQKVMNAELGIAPVDSLELGHMKREKLAAKEKLVRLYENRQH